MSTLSKLSSALVSVVLVNLMATEALQAQICDTVETHKLVASDGESFDVFGSSVAVSGSIAIVGAAFKNSENGAAYLFNTTTGQEISKILPSDGAAGDDFGWSVSISGNIAIVSSPFDDDRGANSGSAYLFDITDPANPIETFKLLPDLDSAGDVFGWRVAIDGKVVIVGAYNDDGIEDNTGAAYLFDSVTGQQIAKLHANDGAVGDNFGYSVAISGDTVSVGSPFDDDKGSSSGAVYVFDTVSGQEVAKLVPDDGAAGDQFGWSSAISGTTVLVGANGDDDLGGDAGSAYLFSTGGGQIAKLLPDDGAAGDTFGEHVAVSGSLAIVGAPRDQDFGSNSGSAYVFEASTGLQTAKLLASDASAEDWFGLYLAIEDDIAIFGAIGDGGYTGAAYLFNVNSIIVTQVAPDDGADGDQFGWSVAVSGATAIIGDIGEDDNGENSGSAYLYDISTGQKIAKLSPVNGSAAGDSFGWSVAISGTTAMVGAVFSDDDGENSGSAYLFDAVTGLEITKLLPDDGRAFGFFGGSIAISGTTAIIGAKGHDGYGQSAGAAYLFSTSDYQQIARLLPAAGGSTGDLFGKSVAIRGTTAIVGAPGDDEKGEDSGSVYFFDTVTGQEVSTLVPNDGAAGDQFGNAIAISGTILIVGAPGVDHNSSEDGAAYLYDLQSGGLIAKIRPSIVGEDAGFGNAVAINGTTAIVGARDDDPKGEGSGSAYLFDALTGREIARIVLDDGSKFDYLGSAVAISGTTAVVGANGKNVANEERGSAYLVDFSCGGGDCLTLAVENLIAGQKATILLVNGVPGAKAVTVYGTSAGQSKVNNYAGYCATFGIKGVNQKKIIGGLNRTFDANGEITFGMNIPGGAGGLQVFFQSAARGTCPDECMSNLVEDVVQQ